MVTTRTRSTAAALLLGASAVLAACDVGGVVDLGIVNPGPDESGTYVAQTITPGGIGTSLALPGTVFQGNLSIEGQTFPVRVEVLSGTLALGAAGGSDYRLTVRYRLVSTDNRFQTIERVSEEVGTYTLTDTRITFSPIGNGFLAAGTLTGNTLVVPVANAVLTQTDIITFRR